MNAFEFSKYAITTCSQFDFIKSIDVMVLDEPVAKIKAYIASDIFINLFYNAGTLKYSFALVKDNRRVFGADNTRKWHVHPFDNPDIHEESGEISLKDFLDTLASNRDKWY